METFIRKLKAAGVQIHGEEAARSHLEQAEDFQQAILALSRQGRSMGVTFTADPRALNSPAVLAALMEAGLGTMQADEFFANVSTFLGYSKDTSATILQTEDEPDHRSVYAPTAKGMTST